MSRHSKNNTSTSVFTYRERQMIKDYGTQKTRLGNDSCKKFDECTLCLTKAQDPHACREGHIFCKSCIIENMVDQKKENAARLQKYQTLVAKEAKSEGKEQKDKEIEEAKKFEASEDNRIASTAETIKFKGKKVTSYFNWLPDEQEDTKSKLVEPSQKVICPGDKKCEIKMKTLYPVIIKDVNAQSVCQACQKELNFQKMNMSRKCGHLFCGMCFEADMAKTLRCSVCTKKCEKDDFIQMQATMSSFSSHNSVEAVKYSYTATI